MDRLNYSHLLYFWLVAREGGVSKAAERVGLAQPMLSGQIRTLESVLGERLFERVGRRLQLTEMGRLVFCYAEEIFSLGDELMVSVKRRPTGRPLRLTIGLDDVITKTMAHRLILPLSEEPDPMRVVVREDGPEKLLASLVANELDVLILDSFPGPDSGVVVFSQRLGEIGRHAACDATVGETLSPTLSQSSEWSAFPLAGTHDGTAARAPSSGLTVTGFDRKSSGSSTTARLL